MSDFESRRLTFGKHAHLYTAVRPSPTHDLLRFLVGGISPGSTVIDAGAGTGQSTLKLADLGYRVVAVEPDNSSVDELTARADEWNATHPSKSKIEVMHGAVEEIKLDDGTVDGAVASTAAHWFDRHKAPIELARVLRRGAYFGVTALVPDESVPDTAWMMNYLAPSEAMTVFDAKPFHFGGHFDRPTRSEHPIPHSLEAMQLLDWLRTRSDVNTFDPERRSAVFHAAAGLVLQRAGQQIDFPFVAHSLRVRRR